MSANDIIRHLNSASEQAKGMEAENIALKEEIKRMNEKYARLAEHSERTNAQLIRERNRMATIAEQAVLSPTS